MIDICDGYVLHKHSNYDECLCKQIVCKQGVVINLMSMDVGPMYVTFYFELDRWYDKLNAKGEFDD